MFEPAPIQAEIMALSLLSGERWDDCEKRFKSNLEPSAFTHTPFSGNATYPSAASAAITLASKTVPAKQCLIITYASVYLCQADETVNSIDFGVNKNYIAYWQSTVNGVSTTNPSATCPGQGILNHPCLFVFPENVTVSLILVPVSSVMTVNSRRVITSVNAYLAPSMARDIFSSMASQPT